MLSLFWLSSIVCAEVLVICLVVWLAFRHAPSLTFSLDLVEAEALPSHRVLLSRWSSVSGRRRRPVFWAGLRPPLKPSVQFSRAGLSQRCASQHLANEGISEIRFTSPNSPYSFLSGNVFQPQHRQRL